MANCAKFVSGVIFCRSVKGLPFISEKCASSRLNVASFKATTCNVTSCPQKAGGLWNALGKNFGSTFQISRAFSTDGKDSNNKGKPTVAGKDLQDENEKSLTEAELRQQKLNKEIADYYSQYEDEYYEMAEEEEPGEWIVPEEETFAVSMERGKTGVIDVEDLLEFLKAEQAVDVCCISVPREAVYADYLVICTAFSARHLTSLVHRVNRLYKRRKNPTDPDLHMEGRKDPKWRVIDMQNIILHVMMPETRQKYDIEQLWAVGPELDSLVFEEAGIKAKEHESIEEWLRESSKSFEGKG